MKRTQLAIDIPLELRQEAKAAALLRNIPLGQWVVRAIRKELKLTMGNPIKQCECYKQEHGSNELEKSHPISAHSIPGAVDTRKYVFHDWWKVIYVFMEITMAHLIFTPVFLYPFIAITFGYMLLMSLSEE